MKVEKVERTVDREGDGLFTDGTETVTITIDGRKYDVREAWIDSMGRECIELRALSAMEQMERTTFREPGRHR